MRSILALVALSLLCAAPCAHAQERAGDVGVDDLHADDVHVDDVVDLQGVQSAATESPRSAFGRVMDIMIARLVEQQTTPARTPDPKRPASLAPDPAPPRAPESSREPTQIDIALGERFALPPADAVTRASVPD